MRRFVLGALVFLSACGNRKSDPPVEPEPPSQEETIYCAEVVLTKQGHVCAGSPLPAEAFAHRIETRVLRAAAGKVTRVERRTGRGALVEDDDGIATWDVEYQGDVVARLTAKRQSGAVSYVIHIDEGGQHMLYRDRFGRPKRVWDTDVVEQRISFDARGFPETSKYFDIEGKPTQDEWGAYARRYVRRDDGARLESTILDAALNPMVGFEGSATIRDDRDERGQLLGQGHFDAEGRPTVSSYGAHRFEGTLDSWGNYRGSDFFGLAGEKVADARESFAWRNTVDDGGCITEHVRLGADGKPAAGRDGWAKNARVCDETGRAIEWQYFDSEGRPRSPDKPGGYTRVRLELDDRGRHVGKRYWDAQGNPDRPISFEARKLDDDDRVLEMWMQGPDGHLAAEKNSRVARERHVYDGFGQDTETSYFDVDDRPTDHRFGYAKVTRRHDETGKVVEEHFTDAAGAPVVVYQTRLLGIRFGEKSGRSRDEALHDAREAVERIRGGMEFERAVLDYGDRALHRARGKRPKAAASYFVKPIAEALATMKVGDVSDVLEGPTNMFIVKREE
ncbi:MAG: hypothetical protein HOW73_41235 [Polyangiaceae bacterium]|nr:hypothetical protein [Polyangiaceae bacterium]